MHRGVGRRLRYGGTQFVESSLSMGAARVNDV